MKIIVCVKQVPDTSEIKWTENNTMIRDGVESILNPFDEYAIETALRIKEKTPGVTVTVVTMGPPQAKDVLKRAIAMGSDDAMLITDKKFAGADTQATSRTVAKAIKEKAGDFDLIICGQFAIDGDTAQTGPSIAEHLNLPQVTYVKEVVDIEERLVTVKREIEEGFQKIEMQLPGLICMLKCDYEPRKPAIKGVMKANRAQIPEFNHEDIGLDISEIGIKGSPTYVSKAFRPKQKKSGEVINESDPKEAAKILIEKLKERKVLV